MVSDKLIWLRHQINKHLIGKVLPIRWFGPKPPATNSLSTPAAPLHLQIVSHCWQYAHMLNFQLSSIIKHPPTDLTLTYTLYYAAQDIELKKLIKQIDAIKVPNVTWQWVEVSKEQLFRRSIGRNQTAFSTQADWVWFSDCDLIFHEACLDSLAKALHQQQTPMVFPRQESITELLEPTHHMLSQKIDTRVDIDPSIFELNDIHKAKGAFQIVHGDVARTCGYCPNIKLYQSPMQHWSKTYEDSMFRRLIGTEGTAIDIQGLYRVRHVEKGRYSKDTIWSRIRKNIRVATDDQGGQP